MRVGYLSLDAAGRTGADNPLTKLKVRQAIWHAIDRKAIADKLVTGGSRVPAAPCFPSQFGCDAEIAVTLRLRSGQGEAAARRGRLSRRLRCRACQLRAAAMGLGGPELPACGRHPRQAQPAPDGGADPARQGGRAADVSRKLGQLFDQRRLGHSCRTSSTAAPTTMRAIRTCRNGWSRADRRSTRRCARRPIRRRSQRITEQAYWAPLHTYVTTYGYAKQLEFTPYPDELPRFYLAKWK